MSRSSYVEPTALGLVLAALQPTNRLVFEVMLATGLRVGDVLKLTTEQVKRQRRATGTVCARMRGCMKRL